MQSNKFFLFLFLILFLGNVHALSNESVQAKNALENAREDIWEMQEKNIPVNRVNESYQDALQIYSAQILLEERNRNADYDVIIEYTEEINNIKEVAIQAKDELKLFVEKYEELSQDTNFSEFEEQYNSTINSFYDERFEETLFMINEGYEKMMEIHSSQTATKVFYLTTTKTLKNFFLNYWIHIIIFIFGVSVVIFVLWNRIVWIRIKRKLHHFEVQKKTVNGLIKKLQKAYFKTRKISETEYRIKVQKYEELLREIERKTMVLREELYKKKNNDRLKEFKIKKRKEAKSSGKRIGKRIKKKVVKKMPVREKSFKKKTAKKTAKKKVVKKKR